MSTSGNLSDTLLGLIVSKLFLPYHTYATIVSFEIKLALANRSDGNTDLIFGQCQQNLFDFVRRYRVDIFFHEIQGLEYTFFQRHDT